MVYNVVSDERDIRLIDERLRRVEKALASLVATDKGKARSESAAVSEECWSDERFSAWVCSWDAGARAIAAGKPGNYPTTKA